ncbi:MAG: bifunctional diaminohydroxyphosphoribosylaminopyrimidine deaminase/5-amino-6-(5-phosphoribosylamino)uracil reductase RibD [Kiritimatiellae bacterium]|nr:bifunctional diaminohydroxyphosphoribosylaminopyrimidine deaminase/5-amino-6-(5-phosphoribosylamino)uracil reductase RibD [Kiritimatiellia bacterium]
MATETTERDRFWMRHALALAVRGEGLTRPNPPVGAVVVRDERVVGEGWHRLAGGPHAERIALAKAGPRARGATLFVTLEPCSTWGRTPPCTDAILAAGVSRVVAACADPNPRHRGRGLRLLRQRGVQVTVGPERATARELIAGFAKWITTGRPWVTLKLAMSFDGRLADANGRSRWISSRESRRWVQAERRRADAILVGVGTVLADDPRLLPRPALGRAPWRVVLDTTARTPRDATLLNDAAARQTVVMVGENCDAARCRALTRGGASVERVRVDPTNGRLDLREVFAALGRRGVLRVLCEGGSTLAGALVKDGLVDELLLIYAPCALGAGGIPALGNVGWPLRSCPRYDLIAHGVWGRDCWVRLRRPT